jgi:cell division protein FtsL
MNAPLAELGFAGALAVAVAVSGLWLIRLEHDARQRFVELEELNREQDRLAVDWGRLQLEQSTWSTHSRIEALAREQLDLAAPKTEQIVVVSEADGEHGHDRVRGPADEPFRGDDTFRGDGDRFGSVGESPDGRGDATLGARVGESIDGQAAETVREPAGESVRKPVFESIRERVGELIRGRFGGTIHERK